MESNLVLLLSTVKPAYHGEVRCLVEQEGIGKSLLEVMDKYWDDDAHQRAKEDFNAKRTDSPFYRLIFEEFGGKIHFQQAESHREFIFKAFRRLRDVLPLITEEQIQVHDLSKYSYEQTVGYTAKWVHGVEWGDPTWQAALQCHYRAEPHHPEHHYHGEVTEMPDRFLQESVLDMVASRWERQLEGSEDVSNFELANFDSKYLLRYSVSDRTKAEELIRTIQSS